MEYIYEAVSANSENIIFDDNLNRHRHRGSYNILIIGSTLERAIGYMDAECRRMKEEGVEFQRPKRYILKTKKILEEYR